MTKRRILVVDDEPDIVRALSLRLRAAKYDVMKATDGATATMLAVKWRPDLVILDIGMPAGDGHLVAKRLRENMATVSIPIIFLTARASEKDYDLAAEVGVDKYITKPFDSVELMAAVDELVERKFTAAI